MRLEPVARLEELAEGQGHLARTGPYQIALFRIGEEVFAIDNDCPHAGASLSFGWLDGKTVACPLHAWKFDLETGECLTVSHCDAETFRVVIEGGQVMVELPD